MMIPLGRTGPTGHHDPLRSTPVRPVFSFGHSWVVLSIIIPLPFIKHRYFAIPILLRLCRKKARKRPPGRPKGERKSTGDATPEEYRTRPELAVEMLEIASRWLDGRRFRVVGDSEYSGKSVSRELPENADLVGRMPMNAALYAEAPPRKSGQPGRPRKKGERLSNPAGLARSRKVPWTKMRVWYKCVRALWYNSTGARLLSIVVVRGRPAPGRDTIPAAMTPLARNTRAAIPKRPSPPVVWRSAGATIICVFPADFS